MVVGFTIVGVSAVNVGAKVVGDTVVGDTDVGDAVMATCDGDTVVGVVAKRVGTRVGARPWLVTVLWVSE